MPHNLRNPRPAGERRVRRLSVHGEQQKQGQGDRAPCHLQHMAHRGTCGKARVVPHNRRPGPDFMEWVGTATLEVSR
jgi:hypothetical protein